MEQAVNLIFMTVRDIPWQRSSLTVIIRKTNCAPARKQNITSWRST